MGTSLYRVAIGLTGHTISTGVKHLKTSYILALTTNYLFSIFSGTCRIKNDAF